MKRSTLDYYRIFAGWGDTAGSVPVALNDFRTLSIDQRRGFCTVLQSAVNRNSLSDIEVAGQFIDCLVDFPVR